MKLLAGFLAAVCGSVVAATGLAAIAGTLSPFIAATALLLGLALAVAVVRAVPTPAEHTRISIIEWLVILAFGLFAFRAFCWLIYQAGDDLRFLSPNNFGDLALHITFIRFIVNGAAFWPENPIFAGEPLHYPIGVDLLNAILCSVGIDLNRSFIWVGLAGAAATGAALWKWGRAFAIAGFLFSGGLAGFEFFSGFKIDDYQTDLAWKSIPLALFITQRGFLYAFPAGLLLLAAWRAELWQDRPPILPRSVQCLLYSTMPLFHLHTFIFLSLLLGCWVLMGTRRVRRSVLVLVAWSVVPATALVGVITGFDDRASSIHFTLNWMREDENILLFWLMNLGLFAIFTPVLVTLTIRQWRAEGDCAAAAFVLPAVGIWIFANFVMLAKWDWDNTKLMIWCYLALLPFVWEFLVRPLGSLPRAAVCILLFFSGAVSLVGGLGGGYTMIQRSELDPIRHATQPFRVDETFAAFPTFNHPLLLSGRKVAVGYTGHLWSHGIAYEGREKLLTALMNGTENWREAAEAIGARYLFWGEREEQHYPDSHRPWEQEALLVAEGDWGEIYDLTLPGQPDL